MYRIDPPTHTHVLKGAHNTVILRRHLEDKRVTAAWIRPFNFFFLYVIFHPSELFFCLSSFYPFVCLLSIHNLSLFSCILFYLQWQKKGNSGRDKKHKKRTRERILKSVLLCKHFMFQSPQRRINTRLYSILTRMLIT